MLLRSDVLALRSEMKCRLATFAWLIAAAMAANFAAPAAAHADTLMLLPTDTSTAGQLTKQELVFDNSSINITGSSSGSISLKPAGGIFNGTIRDTSSTSHSFNGTISFPHYSGTSSENVSLSVSKDGATYSMPVFRTEKPVSLVAKTPSSLDIFYHYNLSAGTRLVASMGHNVAVYEDSGRFFFNTSLSRGLQLFDSSGAAIPVKDGMYVLQRDTSFVRVQAPFYPWRTSNATLCFTDATLFAQIADNQTIDAIKNQTDKLMDTSGSSDIGSAALGGAQGQLDENMSFMEQVDSLAGHFTSISAESDSSVTFPGIVIGEFKLPPAKVDIWEHMGALETPCKTICTGVFIFAWFNGMRALYGRIFHDEKDVILD